MKVQHKPSLLNCIFPFSGQAQERAKDSNNHQYEEKSMAEPQKEEKKCKSNNPNGKE
jgi:hypothetical protein